MADLDSHRQQLKDDFIAARGYWSELWDGVLQLSPEFFEAYSAFSSVPWKHGTLPPKIKELIYVAIDASTTHLYNPGTRIHIANALKQGATRDEVMEVLEIVSVLGIHTISTGLPILRPVFENADHQHPHGRSTLPQPCRAVPSATTALAIDNSSC